MLIKKEVYSIDGLEVWSGGRRAVDDVIEAGKEDELFELLEESFPDGATDTEINDFLWHDWEYIYDVLGIEDKEEW